MLDPSRVLRRVSSESRGLFSSLTPKQRLIERDRWHKRIAYGGRQWGKSTYLGNAHARNALPEPGATSLAIAPTIHKARDLLWPTFERLNREHNAGLDLRRGDNQVVTRQGGKIQLLGLSTLAEAEKIRGYVSPFITLEECGTFRDELLEFALDSCARPATMRYWRRGGRGIVCVGTPSRNVQSYWHKMCLGQMGDSVHFATVRDNPFIPDAELFLRQVLKDNEKRGWTKATPAYRREYEGEFCADAESLPYGRWDGTVLPQKLAPEEGWTVLTLDFGQNHPNAWMVHRLTTETATDHERQRVVTMHKIHLIHASQENHMTTDQVAARTQMLRERFHPNVIRGDSGGGGAQTIFDMQRVHKLPIQPAKKQGGGIFKRDRIWMYDSLLGNATINVYEDTAPWQKQARETPWNDDRDDHHGNYPDHCLDAGLYALEDLTAHMTEEASDPIEGTAAWETKMAEKRWAERVDYWQGQQ